MDLTFNTNDGIFNYRVCAIIKNNNRILAMKNDMIPYYFLPGGRVKLHESAEDAMVREIKEELCINAEIIRPLWLCESFFKEDTTGKKFHELCIYYLVDVSKTALVNNHNNFITRKSKHNEVLYWLDIETLDKQYIYPLFIKHKINNLPENFEMLTEKEY